MIRALTIPKVMPALDAGTPSAVLVFPVPLLALGHPFDRLSDAARARLLTLGLGDPFDVLALAARAEGLVRAQCFLVLLQGGNHIGGRDRRRFRRLGGHFGLRRCGTFVAELHCLLDVADQHLLRGQVFEGADAAELAHASLPFILVADQAAAVPKTERAML